MAALVISRLNTLVVFIQITLGSSRRIMFLSKEISPLPYSTKSSI